MILMKTGNACFLLLMCVSLLFTSCGNSQSKKGEENKVGDDKDAHGCIASAGYTWTERLHPSLGERSTCSRCGR